MEFIEMGDVWATLDDSRQSGTPAFLHVGQEPATELADPVSMHIDQIPFGQGKVRLEEEQIQDFHLAVGRDFVFDPGEPTFQKRTRGRTVTQAELAAVIEEQKKLARAVEQNRVKMGRPAKVGRAPRVFTLPFYARRPGASGLGQIPEFIPRSDTPRITLVPAAIPRPAEPAKVTAPPAKKEKKTWMLALFGAAALVGAAVALSSEKK